MQNIAYDAAELSLLCKEYKENQTGEAGVMILNRILDLVDAIRADERQYRADSVFFGGELTSNIGERNVRRPSDVDRYRERRQKRLEKRRRADAEENEEKNSNGGGHGNTRLPYGLCEKYGIEVQKGWQPHDAWEALAGKGVSAAEEYRKLKERNTAKTNEVVSRHETARKAFQEKEEETASKISEIWKKQVECRNKEIDLVYGNLSRCKSGLLKAEQRSTRAKKNRDLIAGRSREEVEKEYNELDKRVREIQEINRRLYDRPKRSDPDYQEWKDWVESQGGFEKVNADIMREYSGSDGVLERMNALSKALSEYDKFGPDAGYKDAQAEVRKIKKAKKEIEGQVEALRNEIAEYEKQSKEIEETNKTARQEYYDAVKARFPTLDDCKTKDDVAERLTAEGLFYGNRVACSFSDDVSMEAAVRTSKALLDFADKVPALKGHCRRLVIENMDGKDVSGYKDVYGYSDRSDKVALNSHWYGNIEAYEESYKKCLDDGFHPQGTTIDSVVHHEYAHQLDAYLTDAFQIASGDFSSQCFTAVYHRLGMEPEECKAAVSGYSVNNKSGGAVEWFAEALSEFTSSPNPRPVAVEVGKYVNECAKQLEDRKDSRMDEDEDGRWVTTENDHKVHINEEGVPDKGNPYVLAAMRGEGVNPKSSEEVTRHRLQRKAAKIRTLFADLDNAKKAELNAFDDRNSAKHDLGRAELKLKVVERERQALEEMGYGEDDYERLVSDHEEAFQEMNSFLNGRDKWQISGEEKEKFSPIEARYNRLQYFMSSFPDCFGEDAISEEKVNEAREKLNKAQKRLEEAEKATKRAEKELPETFENLEGMKFLSSAERESTIEEIKSSGSWGDMSEDGKAKVIEVIENASDVHLMILKKTLGNSRINDSYGRLSDSGASAWYTPGTGAISMSKEDMEKGWVTWHEYGHYLDDPRESRCGLGTQHGMPISLSDRLHDEHALHSEAVASDMQKLVDGVAPGEYKIERSPYESSRYLVITNLKTGEMVEGNYDTAFCKISDAVNEKFREFNKHDPEWEDYLDSIGCPHESEEPKYTDYIEFYYTPKRHLMRQRERYKGAEEEYRQRYQEYSAKRDEAISANRDEYRKQHMAFEERYEKRMSRLGPVSDILCGAFNGRGPWIYGSHKPDYYSYSDKPYQEAIANYHQMRMMGWTDAIGLLKSISPSIHDSLEKVYNEWLWRNVDL